MRPSRVVVTAAAFVFIGSSAASAAASSSAPLAPRVNAASAPAASDYRVTEVMPFTLSDGSPADGVEGLAVNAAGTVVGLGFRDLGPAGGGMSGLNAFSWSDGSLTVLPKDYIVPSAINASGVVAGLDWIPDTNGMSNPFLWSPGSAQVEDLGLPDGFYTANPVAIADDGTVYGEGNRNEGSYAGTRAWWLGPGGGTPQMLPTYGSTGDRMMAANDHGFAVGLSYVPNPVGNTAVEWYLDGSGQYQVKSLALDGTRATGATDINDAGQVLMWGVGGGSGVVVMEADGTYTEVDGPGGSIQIQPRAMNALGQVIGSSFDSNGVRHPFVWTPGEGSVDLSALVPAGASVSYESMTDINNNGQILMDVTFAGGPSGLEWHTYVLTPVSTPSTVTCTPGSTGSTTTVTYHQTVDCSFTPGAGASFAAWTHVGFDLVRSFTPAAPATVGETFRANAAGTEAGSGSIGATDSNGTAAQSVGYQISDLVIGGADWLLPPGASGGGKGVNVCDPETGDGKPLGSAKCGDQFPVLGQDGSYPTPWQCQELVQRLYYLLGWDTNGKSSIPAVWSWAPDAAAIFTNAGGYPKYFGEKRNGTSGFMPQPGDMIVSSQGGIPHVVIVDTVGSAQGDGSRALNVIEQNYPAAFEPSPGRGVYAIDKHGWISRPAYNGGGAIGQSSVLGTVYSLHTSTVSYTGPTLLDPGAPATLTATLKDRKGAALSGKTLTFTLNGSTKPGTTNKSGIASVTMTAPGMFGPYDVSVGFAGDATGSFQYFQSSATARVSVRISTSITYTGDTAALPRGSVRMAATLTALGQPVAGKTLTFTLAGKAYKATTDATGTATVTATAPKKVGPFPITVTFGPGDGTFAPSSWSGLLVA